MNDVKARPLRPADVEWIEQILPAACVSARWYMPAFSVNPERMASRLWNDVMAQWILEVPGHGPLALFQLYQPSYRAGTARLAAVVSDGRGLPEAASESSIAVLQEAMAQHDLAHVVMPVHATYAERIVQMLGPDCERVATLPEQELVDGRLDDLLFYRITRHG